MKKRMGKLLAGALVACLTLNVPMQGTFADVADVQSTSDSEVQPTDSQQEKAEETEEDSEEKRMENAVDDDGSDSGTNADDSECCETEEIAEQNPLRDEDFYIELTPRSADGTDAKPKRYTYEEWTAYLDSHNHWVNGQFRAAVSDSGKDSYSRIELEPKGTGKCAYTLWAENLEGTADTRDIPDGTRAFEAGIDTEAPALCGEVAVGTAYFEPTSTKTQEYYAEDFVLSGSFYDADSGICRVEYTTDYTAGERAEWIVAASADGEAQQQGMDFTVTLADGCYEAVALRAYDNVGNVSEVWKYANGDDTYIKVVVDKAEPVLNIDAMAGGAAYNGDSENWINKDVSYRIASEGGLYRCEYAYESIGEAVNRDAADGLPEVWTELPVEEDGAARLEVCEDRNGYYYFRAVSKAGVAMGQPVRRRVLIQHQIAELEPVSESKADESKCKNDWYNKASGTPMIRFAYPEYDTGVSSGEYDTGVSSGEYDAPVTIHYMLTRAGSGKDDASDSSTTEGSVSMGVMDSNDLCVDNGQKMFVPREDDLDAHQIRFEQDGIYTLEYWMTDKAGNVSEVQTMTYKIDCHEPTDLFLAVDGDEMPVDSADFVVYERFYDHVALGNAGAEYGVSGKESLQVLQARRIGEWKDGEAGFTDAEHFEIGPDTRCILYLRAEDQAGNVAEGWTRGIVVDDKAPAGAAGGELIVEPEGANAHGFFNDDVKVSIRIKDMPGEDNCAALMSVRSTIGKDGVDTIANRELFSFTKELPTDEELIQAAAYEGVQVVNAKANDSNDAYIEVTAVDRAGNTRTSVQRLKIDATKPEVDISFDNENAANGRFFNRIRTASVHVKELNFDASAVEIAITKDGEPVAPVMSDWTEDGVEHYASAVFGEDGDYTMEARCTDLADNESDIAQTECFTIDQTAPQVAIALVPYGENGAFQEGYFNTGVTAVITVTEHNFNAADFALDIFPASASKAAVWSHDGDVHTARILFEQDGAYRIGCAYTDMAGNAAAGELSREFVIDTANPLLTISGVADGSANSGEVTPVVTAADCNMDVQDVSVFVTTGRGEPVEAVMETAISGGDISEYRFVLSDMTNKADGIYYLNVSACDRAGNASVLTYRFSLNRNGSAYNLGDLAERMDEQYYNYADFGDIEITEMNVDIVEEFELYISRNGALGYQAKYQREVSGSADIGYTYVYHIQKENFAEEGTYRLSLYSKDRAGNEVNNALDIGGREILFTIDNTPPKVVIDGVAAGQVYNVESQDVQVVVADNFKLAEAELTLVDSSDEVLERWDYMALAGDNGFVNITIPMHNGEVSLLYRVRDAAGNEAQTFRGEQAALDDFLVTSSRLVQFMKKPVETAFGRIVLATAAVLCIALAGALFARKRRR